MEREIFEQIWPVFVEEGREQLQQIGAALLELEHGPAPEPVLAAVKRHAHSLKGSAATIGLGDVERLAHALEGLVNRCTPDAGLGRERVAVALKTIAAIEGAFDRGPVAGGIPVADAAELLRTLAQHGGVPLQKAAPVAGASAVVSAPAATPVAGGSSPAVPSSLGALLDLVEERVVRLGTPGLQRRAEVVAEVAAMALEIPRLGGGRAAPLAGPLHEALAGLAAEGPERARAAVAAATMLVDLRALADAPPPPQPAPAPPVPAAAPSPEKAPDPTAAVARGDDVIRVRASTVDSLAHQVELLTLTQQRQARRAREVSAVSRRLVEALAAFEGVSLAEGALAAAQRLRAIAKDLSQIGRDGARDAADQNLVARVAREEVRDLRMLNAAQVLEPLRRAVREVSARLEKDVSFHIEGGDVKVDRRVLDELRSPLVHLVRNAVDHGIEPTAARVAAGKPAQGSLGIRVEPRGPRVAIVLEDDGRGLDVQRIRAAAVKRGVVSERQAAGMTDDEAVRLVFRSGVSTAQKVTDISGRGVGLDVVHEAVKRLQGEISIDHAPGKGTRFTLEVPAALTATFGALARVGTDIVAFPSDVVERALRLDSSSDVGAVAGRALAHVADEQLPFAWLAQLLGRPRPESPSRTQPALLLNASGVRVVLGVDEVIGQQELVVASLGRYAAQIAHFAGATVLDDGRVVPVLNAAEVARLAGVAARGGGAAPKKQRIVVADDALTTRAAMKAVLELAGYAVIAAADGQKAYELVQQHSPELVVSDVQMPRLDGLGLTRAIRATPSIAGTPVILVTSLDAPEDRAAGLEAGADGYLVKREVERGKLLELVRQLLPSRAAHP